MKTPKKRLRPTSLLLIYTVRYMLLIPILIALGYIAYVGLSTGFTQANSTVVGNNIRIIAMSLIAMAVTFGFSRLEKRLDIHLPKALLLTIMLFVVATIVIGDAYGQYERFWWWDDVLHSLSGIITALVGFLLVYFFNARYNMRLSPTFVATFAFTFAITMGVVWEIVEFTFDVLFHTDMQRWDLPAKAMLIGKPYQGSGLRDTMSDLIVACIGALIASTVAYFSYKNERRRVLGVMRRTFPGLASKK